MSKKNKIIHVLLVLILVIVIIVFGYLKTSKKIVKEQTGLEKGNISEKNYVSSTSSYTPENIDRNNNNNNDNNSSNFVNLENRSIENVKVEVLEDTISENGLTIVITDNNDVCYTWDPDFYKIEQKVNGSWQELLPNKPMESILVGYHRDENNQFKFNINWNQYYGTLKNGVYRIVEISMNGKDSATVYSNEFEIKK